MEHNSFGLIIFLTALSIGYVGITGLAQKALSVDATPAIIGKCLMSLVTLPALGIVVTVSYPYYAYGLLGAGIVLGFVLTLNRITVGIAAIGTEPLAVGVLSLMVKRSGVGSNTTQEVEAVLARFGYFLTTEHLGYLTGGIIAGILLGVIPRLMLKHRAIQNAKLPVQTGRQRQKAIREKAIRSSYSRKARKQGALVDRMQALNKEA